RHGGAELPVRRAARRPPLRDGARPDRPGLRRGRAARQDGHVARVSRRVTVVTPHPVTRNPITRNPITEGARDMKRKLSALLVSAALATMASLPGKADAQISGNVVK